MPAAGSKVYEQLLEGNLLWKDTGGATLSLDREGGRVMLLESTGSGGLAMLCRRSLAAGLVMAHCSAAGLLALSGQAATAACGKECYVQPPPHGKAANDGTESAPWPTISHALKNIAPGSAGNPSKIIVKEGEYKETISIDKEYITLEGEIDAASGARLATIDGSQPLSGWKEVILGGVRTSVYKIDGCDNKELVVRDSTLLSKNLKEPRPPLQWKRIIRLADNWMNTVDTDPTHIMQVTDQEKWNGVEALWGCKSKIGGSTYQRFGGSTYQRFGGTTYQRTTYLRFKASSPNMHTIKGGRDSVVKIKASGVTLRNFNIYGGIYGVHVAHTSPIIGDVIENNLISGGADQIRLETNAEGTVIRDNELTANLLGNKRGCKPGIGECWTAGAWANQWPDNAIPKYISVRRRVHEATRGQGFGQLAAIALSGAGPGTIIEGNALYDGIAGIDMQNVDMAVPIEIRHNTIQNMTHFGICVRPSINAQIHDNTLSNMTEVFRLHDLSNVDSGALPSKVFIYDNTSRLPAHLGEHMFFHWLEPTNDKTPLPNHHLKFVQNKFCGGLVALFVSSWFHPLGLGNTEVIGNVFAADHFLLVSGSKLVKSGNKKVSPFWKGKKVKTFTNNKILPMGDDEMQKANVAVVKQVEWIDDTNIVGDNLPLLLACFPDSYVTPLPQFEYGIEKGTRRLPWPDR